MEDVKLKIRTLLDSVVADDDVKGNTILDAVLTVSKENVGSNITLDFEGIELVNTAFLNNAIGQLFNKEKFDLKSNNVRLINLEPSMIDLVEETIAVARDRY